MCDKSEGGSDTWQSARGSLFSGSWRCLFPYRCASFALRILQRLFEVEDVLLNVGGSHDRQCEEV